MKFGGHADQLSRRFWGMDRFRIRALEKMLAGGDLCEGDRIATLETLIRKAAIYAQGARKRGRWAEAQRYELKGVESQRSLSSLRGAGTPATAAQ